MPSKALERNLSVLFWCLTAAFVAFGLHHGFKYFIDYPQYFEAAQRVASGRAVDLYEVDRLVPGKFHYSYIFAWLFSLIALFGEKGGRWAFAVVLLGSYAWLMVFSYRLALSLTQKTVTVAQKYAILIGLFILTLYSANDALMTANIGIVLAALCALSYHWKDRSPLLAGAILGTAIAIKFYPVIVLGYFVWGRERRLVLSAVVTFFILYFGVPLVLEGLATTQTLISQQWTMLGKFGDHWPYDCIWFQNVSGTMLRYFGLMGFESVWIVRGSVLATALLVTAVYWRSFRLPEEKLDGEFRARMFALCMATVPLILPISWYNVGVFYFPAIGLLLMRAIVDKSRIARGGAGIFFTLYCLTANDIIGRSWNDSLEFYSVPFLGAVSLVLSLFFDTLGRYPIHFRLELLSKPIS